jgi:hypothetical protein
MGHWLSERLGQPFVIENRPGAGSNIGTEAAVRAAADGYTLLLVASVNTINASLYDKLSFNFMRDIAPVASIIRQPLIMLVNPSLPVKTVPEFIAYAKANPGKINMASAGNGTSQHIAGELFKIMAGIDMVHVPYRGTAPALTDLLGGQVQVYFATQGPSIEYIRTGKLRALAVTTAARSQALPDLPTVGEFLPGFEASLVYGLGAPRAATICEEAQASIPIRHDGSFWKNVSTVAYKLTTDDDIALHINAVDLINRLRVSRPIVVIACRLGSSESWGPYQHPTSMALTCRWRNRPQHQSGCEHCRKTRVIRLPRRRAPAAWAAPRCGASWRSAYL